jgi:hypothetical protein
MWPLDIMWTVWEEWRLGGRRQIYIGLCIITEASGIWCVDNWKLVCWDRKSVFISLSAFVYIHSSVCHCKGVIRVAQFLARIQSGFFHTLCLSGLASQSFISMWDISTVYLLALWLVCQPSASSPLESCWMGDSCVISGLSLVPSGTWHWGRQL